MNFLVCANWKMNLTKDDILSFVQDLPSSFDQAVAIFPQSLTLGHLNELAMQNGRKFQLGIQNFYQANQGAFTGESSLVAAKSYGAAMALIGHSERRTLFSETDSVCSLKVTMCHEQSVLPVLCVGETLEQRKSGQTLLVVKKQLEDVLRLKALPLVVAYEPVWAIGTGEVATLEQISEVHDAIAALLGIDVPILYGGSVNAANAKEISQIATVGGFLVGGASLKAASFYEILKASKHRF